MENYIKEAKNGFALDAITNDGFYPNPADAMLKLIAYNVYLGSMLFTGVYVIFICELVKEEK